MATDDDLRLIRPINVRQFQLYTLSLDRGPNLEPPANFTTYQVDRGSACGCIPFVRFRGGGAF